MRADPACIPAIVIPYRAENYLEQTLYNIAESDGCSYVVYLVDDNPTPQPPSSLPRDPSGATVAYHQLATGGVGLSYARHVGILAAKEAGHAVCILLDAHMSFVPRSDWLNRLFQHGKANRDTFGCAISIRGRPDNMDAVWHLSRGRVECGSRLISQQLRGRDTANPIPEVFARRWSGNRNISKAQTTACPLGGAYVLPIDLYDRIGQPWRLHRGWGCSEQLVALACWYLDCNCQVYPVPVCHMYRDKAPYSTKNWKILHNNLLLAHLFLPDADADKTAKWMRSYMPDAYKAAARNLPADKIAELRELYNPDSERAQWFRSKVLESPILGDTHHAKENRGK